MTREVILRQVGGSIGATLPKDMAERLHLEVGDRVLAVEADRWILLTPYAPPAEPALEVRAVSRSSTATPATREPTSAPATDQYDRMRSFQSGGVTSNLRSTRCP